MQGPDMGPGEAEEQMYQLKTMCLAKKTVQMPSKEEHGFLLFCGLGKHLLLTFQSSKSQIELGLWSRLF